MIDLLTGSRKPAQPTGRRDVHAEGRYLMTAFGTRALLSELEATVEENLHRHLAAAEDWMPHEYVPWSQGRNFAGLGGEPWSAEQSRLSPAARAALELNLLTEDNLPSYHRELEHTFGHEGAWGAWVNRWTAEEARHASCIRDYLMVTRGVDPEALEHARMATMQTGFDSGDKPLLNVCAYVSFQELATRISHRNTGHYSGDPVADRTARPDRDGREPAHGLLPQPRHGRA